MDFLMDTAPATQNEDGFMYQGHFSQNLDIAPLREKISRHLETVSAVKKGEAVFSLPSVEFNLDEKERF